MSALDAVIEGWTGLADTAEADAEAKSALAELALLRRCRDAVQVVADMERHGSFSFFDGGCIECRDRCQIGEDHAAGCRVPGVLGLFDALAKEVRGG